MSNGVVLRSTQPARVTSTPAPEPSVPPAVSAWCPHRAPIGYVVVRPSDRTAFNQGLPRPRFRPASRIFGTSDHAARRRADVLLQASRSGFDLRELSDRGALAVECQSRPLPSSGRSPTSSTPRPPASTPSSPRRSSWYRFLASEGGRRSILRLPALTHRWSPMRRAIQSVIDGPFGSAFTAADYVDNGIAVVRLGNIGFAEWRAGEMAYISPSRLAEFDRYQVVAGDLLIAGLGDATNHAGRACVAPDLGLAIVKGKCFRARVASQLATADYLALYCSSPLGADIMFSGSRGSTRAMINLDIFKAWPIPLPPLAAQVGLVEQIRKEWLRVARVQERIDTQLLQLKSRREALITAAVTGELQTPTAA